MKKTVIQLLFIAAVLVFGTISCNSKEGPEGEETAVQQEEKISGGDKQESEIKSTIQLGEEYRSEEGGYAFNLVPDYVFEEFFGIMSLDAPDADPDVGPTLVLIGGINEESKSAEQLLEDFTVGMGEDGTVSNQREVIIDGLAGIAVDFEATIEGKESLGMAVFFAVTPTQMFSMVGAAPPERLEGEFEDIFEAVSASITFFEPRLDQAAESHPTDAPPVVVEASERVLVRQWASSAAASSEYSDPDWAAKQATGAPDTPDCGDRETAWASMEPDTIDWLEVGYDSAVTPTEVNIYESHTPSQVALVELIDINGDYHEVYSAVPEMKIDCPYILSIQIEDADFVAAGIKITVDQSVIELPWGEIDAVELVGYTESGEMAQKPAAPTETTDSPDTIKPSRPVGSTQPTEPAAGAEPTQAPSTTQVDVTDLSGWTWTNYTSADGLSDDATLSVAVAEDGTVWAGNFNVGVSRIKDGAITNYGVDDGLGYHNGNALAVEPDGSVWAGTTVGLGNFDGSSWTNYTQKDGLIYETVKALKIAPDGTLWVGTSSGASHYDSDTWTNYTKDDGLVDNSITDIDIDETGNIWFATLGGVSKFDGANWTSYTEQDGVAYNITTAIAVAPDGSVWVGTSSKGVSRFDGVEWTTYAESDEYDLSYVKDILVDQESALWFATEGNGIYRFDGENWLNIRKTDGLPGDWVDAAAVAPDGALWFGFRKEGVGRFGP